MKKEIKNLPASVHDRLNLLAKERGRAYQEFFYYYAIERFLYRLSVSPYAQIFVMKGGLMFSGWGIPLRRPTRDIDVQGSSFTQLTEVNKIIQEICLQEVEPDGMQFDPVSVRGEQIMNEADYQGVRMRFTGYLGTARIFMQMDISFANVITPGELLVEYPSLIGMPAFKIRGYPRETAVAEKFHAMVSLGSLNDRMKDFFDIWLLSQQADFKGDVLAGAIAATFQARKTALPDALPIALDDDFAVQKQADWSRFLKRSRLEEDEYPSLPYVVQVIREFLWPVVQAAREENVYGFTWKAGGSWSGV